MSRKHRWKLDGVQRQGLIKKEQKRARRPEHRQSIVPVLCRLQGKLGHLEPAQDDVGAPAVLRPAGQRGGTAASPHAVGVCVPSRAVLNGSRSPPAGSDAELQPDARLLPVPAGQALRPVLRHRGQGAAVWTPCGHLQAVAHVASKGEAWKSHRGHFSSFCFRERPLVRAQQAGRPSYMTLVPVRALYSMEGHTGGHFIRFLPRVGDRSGNTV